MHIQASILQQEEERQVKILEANYTKVDINAIVEKLVVKRDTKQNLRNVEKVYKIKHYLVVVSEKSTPSQLI